MDGLDVAWSCWYSGYDRAGLPRSRATHDRRRARSGGSDPHGHRSAASEDLARLRGHETALRSRCRRSDVARAPRPAALPRRRHACSTHLQPRRVRRADSEKDRASVRLSRGARRRMGPAPELVLGLVEVLPAVPASPVGAAGDVRLRSGARPGRSLAATCSNHSSPSPAAASTSSPRAADIDRHPGRRAPRLVPAGEDRVRARAPGRGRRRREDRDPA